MAISINQWAINLLIDRIAIILPLSALECVSLRRTLKDLHASGLISRPRDRHLDYMNVTMAKMELKNWRGVTVTIFSLTGKHKENGVKFDWSPAQVTPITHDRFSLLMNSLLQNGVNALFRNGIVRYLEVAIDVKGASVHDYVMTFPRIARSHIYYNAIDKSQSIYLSGRYRSYIMYDKRAELRARHAHIYRGELLRLEYRGRIRHPVSGLMDLEDPFKGLLVADLRAARQIADSQDEQRFLDQCEDDGAHKTLRLYSLRRRRHLRSILSSASPSWFDSASIWQIWPHVVSEFASTSHDESTISSPRSLTRKLRKIGTLAASGGLLSPTQGVGSQTTGESALSPFRA